jgi:hypothetical protein
MVIEPGFAVDDVIAVTLSPIVNVGLATINGEGADADPV